MQYSVQPALRNWFHIPAVTFRPTLTRHTATAALDTACAADLALYSKAAGLETNPLAGIEGLLAGGAFPRITFRRVLITIMSWVLTKVG